MTTDTSDVARRLVEARRIIVVPGFGLAAARAHHELRALVEALRERGVRVEYAVHPVAGRMPGHLNALLDEAGVPHDQLRTREAIDADFAETDVALVVGAADIINPAAETDPASPLFGMAILHVDRARHVVILTRAEEPSYTGTDNPLLGRAGVSVVLGDARASLAALLAQLPPDPTTRSD